MPTPSDPSNGPTGQSSSDVSGDPEALLKSTEECISAHADMNAAYGLGQPIATLGSHPWLRDELADPDTEEPGNAMPDGERAYPVIPPNPKR